MYYGMYYGMYHSMSQISWMKGIELQYMILNRFADPEIWTLFLIFTDNGTFWLFLQRSPRMEPNFDRIRRYCLVSIVASSRITWEDVLVTLEDDADFIEYMTSLFFQTKISF